MNKKQKKQGQTVHRSEAVDKSGEREQDRQMNDQTHNQTDIYVDNQTFSTTKKVC